MAKYAIPAQRRSVLGKQVGALRREGLLPGVVYGPKIDETIQVVVNRRDFERFFVQHGHATLIGLELDGEARQVYIRNVQQDNLKRQPLHVDFYEPNLRALTKVMVPVAHHGLGKTNGGVLTELFTELEIEATPAKMPSVIDVDLSGMTDVGDAIRIGDLKLPKGIRATADAGTVLFILDDTS
ncbi:MAG: 50S ribosomal protein L25, partial [Chloroflexota bacterium]